MNWPLLIIILSQLLFTTSDIIARTFMPKFGFTIASFLSLWFLIFFIIKIIAIFGQLYVFTTIELGKTMALFGATSIILSNIFGILLLKEILSIKAYLGVIFAVFAFFILAIS